MATKKDDGAPEASKKPVTKKAEAAKAKAETVRKAAKAVTVETVVRDITDLGLNVNRSLAQISEEISSKVSELNQVKEAIEAERAELERLHGVGVVASEIDELQLQLNALQEEFKKEEARLQAQHAETQRDLKKQRDREQADYEYNTKVSRRNDQDTWNQTLIMKQREAYDKQEELAKGWKEREEKLAARESYVKDLEGQVAIFPETLKKEVEKAEKIVGNTMKRDHEHAMAIKSMEHESEKKSLAQQVEAQKAAIAQLEAQLATLRAELTAKSAQVVEIAGKAVESASGRLALESLKDVTMSREAPTGSKK